MKQFVVGFFLCSIIFAGTQALSTVGLSTTPSNVPINGIILMLAGTCPVNYTEEIALRGRYVVGVPLGGTLGGTVDSPMSNLEARVAGIHAHQETATDLGANNAVAAYTNVNGSGNVAWIANDGGSSNVSSSPLNTLTTGTGSSAAPYVQVLFCKRT